jgi:FkbM family methyltransferase
MGAIHFSVDPELVRALRRALPLRVFVETGTYRGDTAAAVAGEFDSVITIELAAAIHSAAAARLAPMSNVTALLGHSPEVLRGLAPRLASESVLYWLDAHWCGSETGGQPHECPLVDELATISKLNETSAVLIDDARLFLAPPPPPHDNSKWPLLDEVVERLRALSQHHRLWVINDVFVFAPPKAYDAVVEYGRTRGLQLTHQLARAAAGTRRATPPAGSAGFNAQFCNDDRSERIFAHHLQRLGIERVLDIGANTGQFAAKLRRLGFGGTIYSVEPQRAAYGPLMAAAREDERWMPLARQGAGATRGRMELNLAENGWSSSLRIVHSNHLHAEQTTKTVDHESVFVNSSAHLLRPEFMVEIEAVKIDVQGFEDQVIEGYRPWLAKVRLLLVELSIVECYEGAPDLFTLDQRLVQEFGFSRVSLEPSYYDDKSGVVQQYDGVYYRPQRFQEAPAWVSGVKVGGVVTSVGGSPERRRSDGVDVGANWLRFCIGTWLQFGVRVASVAETAPPPGLEWVRTESRPTILKMLGAVPVGAGHHLLIANSDIAFAADFQLVLPKLDRNAVYYGQRLEVAADAGAPDRLNILGFYPGGFDYFLMPAALVNLLAEERLLPSEYRIGEPWWDFAVPLVALSRGFALKRLPPEAGALHFAHPPRYSKDIWLANGLRFVTLIERLRAQPDNYAAALLDELAHFDGEPGARLGRICNFIPQALP